jgi:hypothetical protein
VENDLKRFKMKGWEEKMSLVVKEAKAHPRL